MNKTASKMCNLWKIFILGILVCGTSGVEIPSDVIWNNFVGQEDISIYENLIKTVSLNYILNFFLN